VSRYRLPPLLIALTAAALSMTAPARADCKADVDTIEGSILETMTWLGSKEKRTAAQKCSGYLKYSQIMTNAHGIVMRCMSGDEQRENAEQMSDLIGDFNKLIKLGGCTK